VHQQLDNIRELNLVDVITIGNWFHCEYNDGEKGLQIFEKNSLMHYHAKHIEECHAVHARGQ